MHYFGGLLGQLSVNLLGAHGSYKGNTIILTSPRSYNSSCILYSSIIHPFFILIECLLLFLLIWCQQFMNCVYTLYSFFGRCAKLCSDFGEKVNSSCISVHCMFTSWSSILKMSQYSHYKLEYVNFLLRYGFFNL